MPTKPWADLITNNSFTALCDCWICRYSSQPRPIDDCPHPRLAHVGDRQAKSDYLASGARVIRAMVAAASHKEQTDD
jgi:hypothetical protein